MKSFVMSQVTLTHTEAVLCRDVGKARASFAFRNPAFGEALLCKQTKMTRGWRSLKVHADASGAQVFDTAQTLDFETKQLEKLPVLDFETKQREKLQSFDFESKQLDRSKSQNKLKIGLVGFGNYGQFLAERMVKLGHTVLAHSRSDYTQIARKLKVQFFRDPDDFCEEHPEVIVLCTSILSTEAVLNALPVQRLRRSTLFVDVLSVKEFPKNLLLQVLPTDFDILCTHPMFGPQSGTGSWSTLPFMFEKVRVGSGSREKRCEKYLNIFSGEGCRMVEMSCEEHDRHAASSQFITHTMGRVLGKLDLKSTPINTMGYETLLNLVNYTRRNSFDLYYGLFMYNINATEELDRLELAFDAVKKQLFSQLHNVLRSQLIDRGNAEEATSVPTSSVDKTERVPAQLVQLKEAANKLDMCLELNSSGHGMLKLQEGHTARPLTRSFPTVTPTLRIMTTSGVSDGEA